MKRALPAMFSKVDTLARLVVRSLPTPPVKGLRNPVPALRSSRSMYPRANPWHWPLSVGQQFSRLLEGSVEHFDVLDEIGEEPALHLYLDRDKLDVVVFLEVLVLR
jgi:hypothetical protein